MSEHRQGHRQQFLDLGMYPNTTSSSNLYPVNTTAKKCNISMRFQAFLELSSMTLNFN